MKRNGAAEVAMACRLTELRRRRRLCSSQFAPVDSIDLVAFHRHGASAGPAQPNSRLGPTGLSSTQLGSTAAC